MSNWRWEYDPDETHVIGGETPAPPAFVAEVESRVDEIVRAAEALHLDGTRYEARARDAECLHAWRDVPLPDHRSARVRLRTPGHALARLNPYSVRPRNSPFTTFPLAFRGSSVTNSTTRGTL